MANDTKMIEVLQQFRVLLRSIKRHYQWVERRSGLAGAQLWALSEIAARPGLKVSDLARQLALHQSTASNLVNRLCALGLVAKARVSKDQRVVRLRPTDKGRRVLKQAPRPLVGVLQQALRDLPPKRLNALHRELAEVLHRLRSKDASARMVPLLSDL
jgi:DNA-binding MarR family transcriptional regulator